MIVPMNIPALGLLERQLDCEWSLRCDPALPAFGTPSKRRRIGRRIYQKEAQ